MGLFPYRNPTSLFAYYLGIFGLIPPLGVVLGPLAIILGVLGLRAAGRAPEVKGAGHSWTGMVLGALDTAVSGGLLIFLADICNSARGKKSG